MVGIGGAVHRQPASFDDVDLSGMAAHQRRVKPQGLGVNHQRRDLLCQQRDFGVGQNDVPDRALGDVAVEVVSRITSPPHLERSQCDCRAGAARPLRPPIDVYRMARGAGLRSSNVVPCPRAVPRRSGRGCSAAKVLNWCSADSTRKEQCATRRAAPRKLKSALVVGPVV